MTDTLVEVLHASLERAKRLTERIPKNEENRTILNGLDKELTEVGAGLFLLRSTMPQVPAANASAGAAPPQVVGASASGTSAAANASSLQLHLRGGGPASATADAVAAPRAPAGSPGLPLPPPPPIGPPPRTITADDIYFYDRRGDLRCKLCYKNGAPCYATEGHIACRQHQQRAQTPWDYNYALPARFQ